MRELEPGVVFAGHRIESVAGRGGMGIVYRATHLALDHVVALKVISPGLAADDVFRRRFKRESRAAVSIRHPNVVTIRHAGEEDGLLFVTMDLIEGTDLRRMLRAHGALEPGRAVRILDQVASALDAAHERGLVHRDVKPGNVLIESPGTGEHVYLTDFGLTKRTEADSGVTETGAFVGTLDYIAPEQIRGERLDARTDVYALGCVLFEMLAGQPPFATRAEKVAKIYGHLEEEPSEVTIYVPEAPSALAAAVRRALAKRPDDRFPSAGALAAAAAAAVEGAETPTVERSVATGLAAPTSEQAAVAAADESTVESPAAKPSLEQVDIPTATRRRRRPGRAILAGAAALAALAAVAIFALGGGDDGGGPPAGTSLEAGEQPGARSERAGGPRIDGPPIRVPGNAVDAVTGAGSVWVSSRYRGRVERLDPATGKRQSRIEVDGEPFQLAFADGFVWVALGERGEAAKIDPGREPGEESFARFAAGADARGIAAGEGAVWVANSTADTVTQLDPESGEPLDVIEVGDFPRRVAVAEGFAWVSNLRSDSVTRIDPETGETREIDDLADPKGIAAARGAVWVTELAENRIAEIDPELGEVVGRIDRVGDSPQGLLAAFGSLWVTNLGGTVAEIDLDAGEAIAQVQTDPGDELTGKGEGPEGIAATDDLLWVTLAEADAVVRIAP